MKPKLSIVGAGGQGRVVADAARRAGEWSEIDFFDDNLPLGFKIAGHKVSGSVEDLFGRRKADNCQLIVGMGDNSLRLSLQKKFLLVGWSLATVVHPWSEVSEQASIGAGTAVMAGVVVNTGARVGQACILNTKCSIDHDCELGDGVHICPGATLAGHVTIGAVSTVGVGASISNGIVVGSECTLGAGAVAIRNIPNSETHIGCPAMKLR